MVEASLHHKRMAPVGIENYNWKGVSLPDVPTRCHDRFIAETRGSLKFFRKTNERLWTLLTLFGMASSAADQPTGITTGGGEGGQG